MKLKTFDNRQLCFIVGFFFQLTAFFMMHLDAVPHGFGLLTLWIGPIVLTIGLLLPAIGLSKFKSLKEWYALITDVPMKSVGFVTVFVISFMTYLLTLAPTASLWDCSETIAAAYKLQVPHTPGTPLTLLIARLFSMLALGDVLQVAWFVNLMSATFSAMAVAFLFLTTWHFGAQVFHDQWLLLFGSVGGMLCFAFSDSFWFSAIEAETYAPSVFFMVFLIWLSIQGSLQEEKDRKRVGLLVAYLIGLSYCIHPMCILIIPVCVLIWRSKTAAENWRQVFFSLSLGILCILFISKIVAVDIFEWAFRFDLFLVNQWAFPFYSGVWLLVLLIASGLFFIWKHSKASRWILASLVMVMLGFSPYFMLFIRSSHLPPINEFSPNNLAKIKPYMNRESYPSRPLLYGPYFDAKVEGASTKARSYAVDGDQYLELGEIPQYQYEEKRKTVFPRIYSNDPAHITIYRQWTGLGENEVPRFLDNLTFMFRYQLGHMYGRYFMWNFAGRAGDIQHAQWLAPWQGSINRSLISYSKANNQYYIVPFLLGLLGMTLHLRKDRKGFVANLSFFLITGLLLAIYLNATPNEPRERDYIYVGSYAAFCIWIGIGLMWLTQISRNWKTPYLSGFLTIALPLWMFYQNWDDHNRSDRTYQIDHARNLLGSCEKGAILFTGGDNDTFPLWYLQDVEGFRTDVRVKVMSYFNVDWYINQLSRPYYDSPPFQLTLQLGKNQYGPYDPLYIHEKLDAPISWSKYMEALKAHNPNLMLKSLSGSDYFFLPSRELNLSTSEGTLDLSVSGSYLPKSEIAILDLIHGNDWKRPIYFNFTSLNSLNINIKPYLKQEGLIYKLSPLRNGTNDTEIHREKSYKNLVVNADYSNLSHPNVYFNHEDFEMRMIIPLKFTLNALINDYAQVGNMKRVKELTSFAFENLYFDHLEPSYADIQLARFLKGLNKSKEFIHLANRTFQFYHEKIDKQLNENELPATNDLLICQEASSLLGGADILLKYRALFERVKNLREY